MNFPNPGPHNFLFWWGRGLKVKFWLAFVSWELGSFGWQQPGAAETVKDDRALF